MKDQETVLVRIQYEVEQEQFQQIQDLRKTCGLRTQKEAITNALAFLKWAVRQRQNGCQIVSESPDGSKREFNMPALEHAARIQKQ